MTTIVMTHTRTSCRSAWFVALFLSVIAIGNGCKQEEAPTPHLTQQHVHATESSQTTIVPSKESVLWLVGTVAFGEDAVSKIFSPVQGRVVNVRAQLGQPVQEGDVLLTIDSPDITAAYADYLKETAEFEFTTRTYKLSKELYDTQALAFNDLKQAENALVKEEAEYRQAKERLVALRVPRAQLENPRAGQHGIGRFELKSALSGTVVDRTVTPGQWVGTDPSQILLIVADLNRLQIVAEAHEQELARIHVEDAATVTVEAYPDEEFQAHIATIGDVVDPNTRTVKVRAWLNNESHQLKPGMYAKVRFGQS
jgi:cobalt-zinc-cadmium efflux system membrane fusion protein